VPKINKVQGEQIVTGFVDDDDLTFVWDIEYSMKRSMGKEVLLNSVRKALRPQDPAKLRSKFLQVDS
jgi:hypothetical protein